MRTISQPPPSRDGRVWAIQIHPGGRKVYRRIKLAKIDYPDVAVKRLHNGEAVYVWPDELIEVLRKFEGGRDG